MSAPARASAAPPSPRHGSRAPRVYNILHTVRGLRVDGVVMVVLRTLSHARSPEFEHVACAMLPGGPMTDAFRAAGIEPHSVEYGGPATFARSVQRMVRFIRERRIDLVHANRTLDLAIAGTAAKLCGIPVVSSLHWLGRTEDHPEDDGGKRWSGVKRRATVLANRALATRIIAVSAAVRDSFERMPGFPAGRTEVVHPGLDMHPRASDPEARERLRAELGIRDAQPVLLNVGRLHPVKGQRLLLPMMRRVRERLPAARLLIAGRGPLREQLARDIDSAGLSEVITLLGSRSDVDALLEVSDALVLSSESEAAPLPPMEAMRAARPVIATDVGGVAEIVRDGVSGYVVPRGDADALASAVLRLFAEPEAARRMGAAGREIAERRFDVRHSLGEMERIYRSLLAARADRS